MSAKYIKRLAFFPTLTATSALGFGFSGLLSLQSFFGPDPIQADDVEVQKSATDIGSSCLAQQSLGSFECDYVSFSESPPPTPHRQRRSSLPLSFSELPRVSSPRRSLSFSDISCSVQQRTSPSSKTTTEHFDDGSASISPSATARVSSPPSPILRRRSRRSVSLSDISRQRPSPRPSFFGQGSSPRRSVSLSDIPHLNCQQGRSPPTRSKHLRNPKLSSLKSTPCAMGTLTLSSFSDVSPKLSSLNFTPCATRTPTLSPEIAPRAGRPKLKMSAYVRGDTQSILSNMDLIQCNSAAGFLGEDADGECPICLEEVTGQIELSCKHRFCRTCVTQCVVDQGPKTSCPTCRKGFSRRELKRFETSISKQSIEGVNHYVCSKCQFASRDFCIVLDHPCAPPRPRAPRVQVRPRRVQERPNCVIL